jgi:hypothetical protein
MWRAFFLCWLQAMVRIQGKVKPCGMSNEAVRDFTPSGEFKYVITVFGSANMSLESSSSAGSIIARSPETVCSVGWRRSRAPAISTRSLAPTRFPSRRGAPSSAGLFHIASKRRTGQADPVAIGSPRKHKF